MPRISASAEQKPGVAVRGMCSKEAAIVSRTRTTPFVPDSKGFKEVDSVRRFNGRLVISTIC